ncbi:NADH dehydrogenase (ubiquinone) 1 beta subcomplex, 2, 8kDa [Megalopta genalis]|uniref:NADH dehydrogenase (ubiquinone) 1 beta subcomplex, 2, 8kDa n=1 Tax=Megalopta genalis TaxID=115081 RepID=UPI003FD1E314
MLISRGAQLLKAVCKSNARKNVAINFAQTRGCKLFYRSSIPPYKIEVVLVEILMGTFYWWLLWNMWHDWDLVFIGHHPLPYPEHWSDEELGIPPE